MTSKGRYIELSFGKRNDSEKLNLCLILKKNIDAQRLVGMEELRYRKEVSKMINSGWNNE